MFRLAKALQTLTQWRSRGDRVLEGARDKKGMTDYSCKDCYKLFHNPCLAAEHEEKYDHRVDVMTKRSQS